MPERRLGDIIDPVVRTIVQLTEEQHAALRELAAARSTSIAALVREGVEQVLAEREQRRARRIAAMDELAALGLRGPGDLGREHDRYLGELDEW